jgi:ABC-2 type transport system ATP-binding protein
MVKTLEIKGLRKIYSNGFEALKGIELEIKPGDFFALLGPNGAGKSTTIGIITGLVSKTSGTVRVFGHDTDTESEAAKAHIFVLPVRLTLAADRLPYGSGPQC